MHLKQPGTQAVNVKAKKPGRAMPFFAVFLSFFLLELFGFLFLNTAGDSGFWDLFRPQGFTAEAEAISYWPLAFGLLWALLLSALVRLLPRKAGRVVYGIFFFLSLIYTGAQTGYFLMFREMMWLSDFRYAGESTDYLSTILTEYPTAWRVGILALAALGIVILCRFPRYRCSLERNLPAGLLAAAAILGTILLPKAVFLHDQTIRYARSDYGRSQSAEAAYNVMYNAHRVWEICGLTQTGLRDLSRNILYPLTPGYARQQREAVTEIDQYFAARPDHQDNAMTGMFAGKNVILVLMESMDDWALGAHTPTINRLMEEGINFTNFYTPGYGSIRTFNTEFAVNTGSFLSSRGGFAFDYVVNDYRQSLANQLKRQGYSALTYHYNDPSFYSRGVFEPAMGYDGYLSYQDYITEGQEDLLYDDQFLFDHPSLRESFFRQGPKLNFLITRSAHLSYVYNEVLSYWGLKKYPEFRGMTGSEEEDCMYLKAKLVDDMFARLLAELEAQGELENTVIVGFTDHYTYGIENQSMVLERSGITEPLLVEKTPCFIWSPGGPKMAMGKTLNSADLLPTLLNLMGIDAGFPYVGWDAFDPNYEGYVLFPDGSWITSGAAFDNQDSGLISVDGDPPDVSQEEIEAMVQKALEFVRITDLILETDYYRQKGE